MEFPLYVDLVVSSLVFGAISVLPSRVASTEIKCNVNGDAVCSCATFDIIFVTVNVILAVIIIILLVYIWRARLHPKMGKKEKTRSLYVTRYDDVVTKDSMPQPKKFRSTKLHHVTTTTPKDNPQHTKLPIGLSFGNLGRKELTASDRHQSYEIPERLRNRPFPSRNKPSTTPANREGSDVASTECYSYEIPEFPGSASREIPSSVSPSDYQELNFLDEVAHHHLYETFRTKQGFVNQAQTQPSTYESLNLNKLSTEYTKLDIQGKLHKQNKKQ